VLCFRVSLDKSGIYLTNAKTSLNDMLISAKSFRYGQLKTIKKSPFAVTTTIATVAAADTIGNNNKLKKKEKLFPRRVVVIAALSALRSIASIEK